MDSSNEQLQELKKESRTHWLGFVDKEKKKVEIDSNCHISFSPLGQTERYFHHPGVHSLA